MWSHLGGAEFASGNIWRDIWNRRQSVTQWFFSLFVSFSDCWPSFSFCCTFVHLISSAFPILYSSFRYLHVSTICFLFFFFSVCHFVLLVSLSPSFSHHLFLSPAFLLFFFPPLQHISFSHHPHFGKPYSQTFRDFLGDCKQVSQTLCRHELVLMLQLWKSTGRNPVKQGNQQA